MVATAAVNTLLMPTLSETEANYLAGNEKSQEIETRLFHRNGMEIVPSDL